MSLMDFVMKRMNEKKHSQGRTSLWPLYEQCTEQGFLVGGLLDHTTDILKVTILVLNSS